MRTLFRYLKPYWLSIVLVIALLFIQANADLSLPDYLSKIVNIGIQQGGIEPDIPQVIRTSSFEALGRLMQAEGAGEKFAVLQKVYEQVRPGSAEATMLSKKWPLANSEPVMSLNLSDKAAVDAARQVFLAEYPKLVVMSQLPSLVAAGGAGALGGAVPSGQPGGQAPGSQTAPSSQVPGSQATGALAGLSPQAILAQIDSLDPLAKSQLVVRGLQKEFEALGVDTVALQTGYILNIGAIMLIITLISVASTIMVGYLGSRVAAGTARDLRRAVFTKVEDFSLAEFDSFSTASLITRSTNDVTQVQMMIMMGTRMLFYAPIIGIGGVIRALGKASGMWWIIAGAVGVLIGIIGLVFALVVPRFRTVQKLVDRLNLVVRENLSGMMVIRAFNRQDHEVQRFDKANRDLTGTMLYVTRVMVVLMPLMTVIMNVVSVSIIWVGSHEVAAGSIRVGDMMAFMQYSMQIFFAFLMMSMMFIMLPRASVSADRIAEVVNTPVSIRDPETPKPLPRPVRGEIEFRNVRFRYPGAQEDVLHDISFTARPGTTTAIIGTTGSGKSTLVSLIPRLYDVTEGSVLFDGTDIRTLALSELRGSIGFVPQKSMLFSGSIADNVRYGKDSASEEEVRQALELSQIWSLAEESSEGLERQISQGGMNVSGGQRQRLAIARALVRRAPVYIFDESFSALDYRTERAIREALKTYARDSTVFLVSQRVAPIRHAEQIIVLDDGHVVGIGKHEELMKTCDVYRDIALSQLKQEELA
jgi:ATP-binding cassette subfamily B protein